MVNELFIREENEINYFKIAQLFQTTYPEKISCFSVRYISWRYKKQFDDGVYSIGLYSGEKKIGQASIFKQSIQLNGITWPLAQLGDLAVHPDYRSFKNVSNIYKILKEIIKRESYQAIMTVPNERSVVLNKRFLKIKNIHKIAYHVGITPVFIFADKLVKHQYINEQFWTNNKAQEFVKLCLQNQSDNHILWNIKSLYNRLCDPNSKYMLSWCNNIGVISTKHMFCGMPYFIIRAIICKNPKIHTHKEIKRIIQQIARYYKTPFWLYWGINELFEQLKKSSFLIFKLNKNSFIQTSDFIEKMGGITTINLIDVDIL